MAETVKQTLEAMSQAERDGILLENAAAEINGDKGKKKAEAKPAKTKAVKKPVEKAKSKKQATDEEAILIKWKTFVSVSNLSLQKAGTEDIYLKVEAWNYLFALMKMVPTIVDVSRFDNEDGKTIYIAKAALYPIGADPAKMPPAPITAFGACRVEESDFYKEEYAALSMAQTRAIGKLGRTAYGHLATACGFKACPWEEMEKK